MHGIVFLSKENTTGSESLWQATVGSSLVINHSDGDLMGLGEYEKHLCLPLIIAVNQKLLSEKYFLLFLLF